MCRICKGCSHSFKKVAMTLLNRSVIGLSLTFPQIKKENLFCFLKFCLFWFGFCLFVGFCLFIWGVCLVFPPLSNLERKRKARSTTGFRDKQQFNFFFFFTVAFLEVREYFLTSASVGLFLSPKEGRDQCTWDHSGMGLHTCCFQPQTTISWSLFLSLFSLSVCVFSYWFILVHEYISVCL